MLFNIEPPTGPYGIYLSFLQHLKFSQNVPTHFIFFCVLWVLW